MVSAEFKQNIASLDFTLKDGGKESGVVLTSGYEKNSSKLSPQELFALETAKKKFEADAVYFRYFDDGRESMAQIYIYDNTDNHLNEEEQINIHRKVWSGCSVPLFIIIEKFEVKVFDSREKIKDDGKSHAFEIIKIAGNALSKFSAKTLDDGLFWEGEKYQNKFQFSTSAYRDLIDGLKRVYTDFQKTSNLNPHVALKLLVQCLLIKYLEERDEESKTGYFAKTYFKSHFNSNDFCEVIRSGQLLSLLDKLSVDFNGKIFEWDAQGEKAERAAINKASVKRLADYLDGDSRDNQYVLWRLYSFSHLPVELISSVYEELLTNSKDIVYTPEMIVGTLVDECMPLNKPKEDFKLIDVSCGSGIFLVKSYKRIVQWWRYKKFQETGVLERPDLNTLKSLLTKSIFGLDVQGDAIKLSIFSLALALLDELDPKTIWQKLKFPDLEKHNIAENDFFNFISNQPQNNFDLVIGNPPFNVPAGVNKGEYVKELKRKYNYKSDISIPYHNLALMFLVESMKLLKPNALLCLIQPSGPLLYQKNEKFKHDFFSKYNLLQILDFTKLADVLWGKKNIATAAIFVQNTAPDSSPVVHIVANRTPANLKKLFLELDYYDFHSVSKSEIFTNPFVWKANVIGGGRIATLVEKISKLRTLGEFLDGKESEGWANSDGFKVEGMNRQSADYITGKDFLPTQAFTSKGINWEKVHKCDETEFERPRNKKIYSPPHILIKANIGRENLLLHFSDEYLVFKSKIIGIHAPNKQRDELLELYNYLGENSDLIRFFIAATSSQLSVNRATALLNDDFKLVPYPNDISAIKTSEVEKVLINDVVKYQLSNTGKDQLSTIANKTNLKQFADVYCRTLNSVYKADSKKFQLNKVIDSGNYFALHFEYTASNLTAEFNTSLDLAQYVKNIIPTRKRATNDIHIQRILKYYGKDNIVICKPKLLRYWLQSIALRDADETYSDYINAGF